MTKLSKNALKLIKNLKSFVPSAQSLRSSEAIIKTIQDLYEQCLEFIRVFGGVVAQITQEGEGYYKDLDDVPQVGEGVTTINVNRTPVGSINANSISDFEIDIPVPTKMSELANDANYILLETLRQILSAYATIASIPTKVSQLLNDSGYLTQHQDISGKADKSSLSDVATSGDYNDLINQPTIPILPDFATVATSGDYNDLNNKPTIPVVPTRVSAFENDAGYLKTHQSLANYYTKQQIDNKGYLTEHQDISGKVDKETGKGLSTNDYTTVEKNKLAGIAEGAEVNVNPDWNAISGKGQILNKPRYALGTTEGGAADRAAAIPMGRCDSTSTSTRFTATVPGITELKDGVCVLLDNGVVTSASGFTLNINGLGAKPVYNSMAAATRDTTIFNKNYTMLFVYDETRVSGGCWVCYRGYDANTNTIAYQVRGDNTSMPASDTARYYKIYFTSADGKSFVPASVNSTNNATSARPVNQRPIDPFGSIVYMSANTNFAAGANLAAASCWQQYNITLGYSFNRTGAALTLVNHDPVYLKCTPQANGSAIMDADTPIVQSLPTTKDGYIYIFLGVASGATTMELRIEHPVYWHDGEGIRLWTGKEPSEGGTSNTPMYFELRSTNDPDIVAQFLAMKQECVDVGYVNPNKYFSFYGGDGTRYWGITDWDFTQLASNNVIINGDWWLQYDAATNSLTYYYND